MNMNMNYKNVGGVAVAEFFFIQVKTNELI